MVVIDESDYLAHYGVIRRSGRYPWGSGGDPLYVSDNQGFMDWVRNMRAQGMTDPQIAEGLGLKTPGFRAQISISTNEIRESNITSARALRENGWSHKAIGERLGQPGKPISESVIRSWLAKGEAEKQSNLQLTANMLRKQVDEKGVIDIGKGVCNSVNVSEGTLSTAAAMLKSEGYQIHQLKIEQLGTGKETWMKVLAKPGITQKEVWQNPEKIRLIDEHISDDGRSVLGIKRPLTLDPSRLAIKYKEDGGEEADGVMHVRPGVEDVSLGGKTYAQVRVQVGDGHFIKGMAIYDDNLPKGVDVMFHTNKSDTGNKLDALKPLKTKSKDDPEVDWDNPFGAVIKRQITEDPNDRHAKLTSVMNLVNEEGDWSDWSSTIAPQVLSKQTPKVAKIQLDATYKQRREELDEIMSLTNPTVKKKLLQEFSDKADAAAVHLKAAGFPRQNWNVIMPISAMNPTEIYAPNFRPGETVALIRYPHGGTFEIPELKVNNNNPAARKALGQARDAVGIHHSVAERLSGADFDGDTVLVIPNNKGNIKSTRALDGLKEFNPKRE